MDNAPSILPSKDNEVRRSALRLGEHSFWTGVAFAIIILVAVVLEGFSKLFVSLHWIPVDGFLDWAIRIAAYALVVMDLALLLGVVGKQSWRFFRSN